MELVLKSVEADKDFLATEHKAAIKRYNDRLKQPSASRDALKNAAWDTVELGRLLELSSQLLANIEEVQALLKDEPPNQQAARFQLKHISYSWWDYLMKLFKKKRQAASHILVIMVSDEKRRHKPYAIPVQYVPYTSLRDQHIRDLTAKLKDTMTNMGLTVVGECTILCKIHT